MRLRWDDCALAVVALVLGLYQVWFATVFEPGWPGAEVPETVAVALLAGSLLVRRPMPLRALGLLVASGVLQFALLTDPHESQIAFETFVALLLVGYAVASRADPLHALYAFSGVVFLQVVGQTLRPARDVGEEVIGVIVILALVWATGNAVRRRQERVAELEREAEQAIADERARIARELHDVIAHGVSVMIVETGAARQAFDSDPEEAKRALLSAEETGREALAEMRRLVGLMREPEAPLAPAPGIASLPALVDRFSAAGLPVELNLDPAARQLPGGQDLAAYRVVQEGLTNVLRHAGRVATRVDIDRHADAVRIAVRSGPGAGTGGGGGHGLAGLRERVGLYRGRLSARRQGDGGFLLEAEIPL